MSTILVNTLTGTSTAGSIAVTGEGNSTTTNLQQGTLIQSPMAPRLRLVQRLLAVPETTSLLIISVKH